MNLHEKRELYSSFNVPIIEQYKQAFIEGVGYYDTSLFPVYRKTLISFRDEIVKIFGIPVDEVCQFAFNYDERVNLLNGIFTKTCDDHLYFIESHSHIKIGRSMNLKQRMTSLQVSYPEKLKYKQVFYGRGAYEFKVHSIFDYLRVSGEWFEKHQDIYDFIKLLESQNQNEPPINDLERPQWKVIYDGKQPIEN